MDHHTLSWQYTHTDSHICSYVSCVDLPAVRRATHALRPTLAALTQHRWIVLWEFTPAECLARYLDSWGTVLSKQAPKLLAREVSRGRNTSLWAQSCLHMQMGWVSRHIFNYFHKHFISGGLLSCPLFAYCVLGITLPTFPKQLQNRRSSESQSSDSQGNYRCQNISSGIFKKWLAILSVHFPMSPLGFWHLICFGIFQNPN